MNYLPLVIVMSAAMPLVASAKPRPSSPPRVAATQPAAPVPPRDSLASLQEKLDQVLAPSGVPIASFEQSPRDVLVDLASRAGVLARQPLGVQTQLAAGNLEMRAYNALAQSAQQANRPGEASLRIAQLRSSAQQIQQLSVEQAPAVGAFWLLQADLMDIARNHPDLASRQTHSIAQLQKFLDDHGQSEMALPVKVALLRVALQAGQSDRVGVLWLELRRSLGRDDPQRVYLEQARVVLELLGEPIELNLTTVEGQTWSLAQQRGRPVLIHVYAPGHGPSLALVESIEKMSQALGEARVSMLSLAVNQAGADGRDLSWPVVQLADDNPVWKTLGATALPWLVVVDADGKVAAVGQTAAVLEQIESLAPPELAPATQPASSEDRAELQ